MFFFCILGDYFCSFQGGCIFVWSFILVWKFEGLYGVLFIVVFFKGCDMLDTWYKFSEYL